MRKRLLLMALVTAGILAGFIARPAAAANCYELSPDFGFACEARPTRPRFAAPLPVPNSLLDRTTYAYMEDFANVYPEPTTTAAPLYNVGEGFLYVTLQNRLVNEAGEAWYQLNYGQYIQEKDIRLVKISQFTGVELLSQPEEPFGWILARVQPSGAPGAEPDPDFSRLERYTFFQVSDAAQADDGWIWYNIGGGRWVKQTFVGLVDVTKRPEEVGPDEFWTEVDLYEQTFAAYEGDRMVFASLISSGLNRWPTHEGLFQVWSEFEQTKMSGAEGKVDYYFIEDVPHTLYFDYDIALHGAYWHDRFGYKHSHGCVNMPPRAAEWLFNWRLGAPNALWVYVHTSNPNHYLARLQGG